MTYLVYSDPLDLGRVSFLWRHDGWAIGYEDGMIGIEQRGCAHSVGGMRVTKIKFEVTNKELQPLQRLVKNSSNIKLCGCRCLS
jgi:hypothetical protein